MVGLLGQALRAAVTAPPPSDDEGLGTDTPDSGPPVTLTLGGIAHSVVDPWGDWGDFSNPKAHSKLLGVLQTQELERGAGALKQRQSLLTALTNARRGLDLNVERQVDAPG
jgi:hypothetical protein